MYFGEINTTEAIGCYLAHSIKLADIRLRKGLLLKQENVERLIAEGHLTVTVARLEADDIHEDEAARQLADALCGTGLRCSRVSKGRVNLHATHSGLFVLSRHVLLGCNAVTESITVATLGADRWVEKGKMVATVKIIPYAVRCEELQRVLRIVRMKETPKDAPDAQPALRVCAPVIGRAHLIQSRLQNTSEKLLDKTTEVTRQRLLKRQITLASETICDHNSDAMSRCIDKLVNSSNCHSGDWLVIVGASAISDRADVIPSAVAANGGQIERLGIPVDPGNLLMYATIGEHTVLGMPGCARSPKYNGFDLFIDRLACRLPVDKEWIDQLAIGGLIGEILDRPQPRSMAAHLPAEPRESAGARKTANQSEVVGVLLAAGSSRRFGKDNKLLADWHGEKVFLATLANLLNSHVSSILVITGQDAQEIGKALNDRFASDDKTQTGLICRNTKKRITVLHNPHYPSGMGSSLKLAIAELLGQQTQTESLADCSALICLGDMPMVKTSTIDQLIDAASQEKNSDLPAAAYVPVSDSVRGNPVLLKPELYDLLLELDGDRGARALLSANPEQVVEVPVEDPGILLDIDTPQQLDKALELLEENKAHPEQRE